MSDPNADNASYAQKTLTGALYMTGMRWVIRFIGLISISITARILTPEDFGIHSSAAMILGLFLVLRSVGVGEFLVKEEKITPETINTGWTVAIFSAAVITVGLLIFAPFAPALLKDDRVTEVLFVLAFVPLINAFNHPRLMLLMREFRFEEIFRVRVTEKVITFVAMVGLIYTFQTYWAIALGSLVASTTFTAYTYLRWPGRGQFTFAAVRKVGGFAAYSMVRALSKFTAEMADSFVARQVIDTAQFGGYHNTKDMARNLVYETASPIAAVMLPTLSRLRGNAERFNRALADAYGVTLYWVALLASTIYLLGDPIVRILLGEQWLFAVDYLKVSACIVGLHALEQFLGRVFLSQDRQPLLAGLSVIKAVVTIIVAISLIDTNDPINFLLGTLSVWAAYNVLLCVCIGIMLRMGTGLFRLYITPTIAVSASLWLCSQLQTWLQPLHLHFFIEATALGTVLFITYVAVIYGLWMITGRKAGPEMSAAKLIAQRFNDRRKTA